MAEKKGFVEDGEVEIGLSQDAIDRIEEYWFEQIGVSDDDYVYVKKINNHIVLGKAKIEFIE
jgi:hypothetical protein